MSDECKMMYTAQADIVLDTLARDGVYYVKKELCTAEIPGNGVDLS